MEDFRKRGSFKGALGLVIAWFVYEKLEYFMEPQSRNKEPYLLVFIPFYQALVPEIPPGRW